MAIVPFLREKIREGKRDAAVRFQMKSSEDEGVAHGATPNPDLSNEYKAQFTSDAIDKGFGSGLQINEDPSAMTQPGVLQGALNQWNRSGMLSQFPYPHDLVY